MCLSVCHAQAMLRSSAANSVASGRRSTEHAKGANRVASGSSLAYGLAS